ncbi:AraC family transcriptional regulator [Paenibacillus physcomitrellae]|uniref:AraC family transcriptional regulator n=1 Tax=Paenibacillus physcomitrellae TaxID=1619311 RepID=A0ABQ1FWF4_9BACL|nr:AraC family transcriptional regulator [Paenibacillus physcomitrellae]GGA32229.1 AraC family transcriptional regulator [Paenibacillus physcomitrellae]
MTVKPHKIAQHYIDAGQDIQFYYTGTEQCLPGHSWGPGIKDHYKILYIHSGQGIYRTPRETHRLSAGQAFLLTPGELCFYQADETDPWNYSWVAFNGSQAEHYLRQGGFTHEHPVISCSRDAEIRACLNHLFDANQQPYSNPLRVASALYAFLSILLEPDVHEAALPQKQQIHNDYVRQGICYIQRHYTQPITIENMASALGLHRKYIAQLFKASTGLPPQQYLTRYRMEKACELLSQTALSIKEIAFSVGYADQLLFSRMFKKTTGYSPTDFRMTKTAGQESI